MLGEYATSEIVGEADSAQAAGEAIRAHSPDLVFLAVRWPEGDAFSILGESNGQSQHLTVFIAGSGVHVLSTFERHGVDYLLEPLDRSQFRAAYENARAVVKAGGAADRCAKLAGRLEQIAREAAGASPATATRERILVKSGHRAMFLNMREIDWIEAAGNYVKLHTAGSSYIVRESISKLEGVLDEAHFARVHRSTIVNLDRIRELRPWISGEMIVVLRDGTELKLSRSYRKEVERRVAVA